MSMGRFPYWAAAAGFFFLALPAAAVTPTAVQTVSASSAALNFSWALNSPGTETPFTATLWRNTPWPPIRRG